MIHQGNSLEILKTVESNSIDSLITDPPAGISFMNKEWDKPTDFIKDMTEIYQECLRVLKPGAHGLIWAIPRTSHWTATALEQAGFEIRDIITHIFGGGFPKSLDVSKAIDKSNGHIRSRIKGNMGSNNTECRGEYKIGEAISAKQWQGFGTALKPSFEAWLLVAKPFTTVPLDAILDETNSSLRDFICQQFPAKYVEHVSKSSLRDFCGRQCDFALWLVEVFDTVKSIEQEQKTDILISPEMASIFLSIVTLWKSILDVILENRNTFTISMESSLIIELKILRSSILQTMQESTIQEEIEQNIEKFHVAAVEKYLVKVLERLKDLLAIFVQENVSTKAVSLSEEQRLQLLNASATVKGVLSEHWILIRKPLGESTVAKNVLKHGTGALNIDESRIGTASELVNHPKVVSTNKHEGYQRPWNENPDARERANQQKLFAADKCNNLGRFPANLVLSHNEDCDEQCTDGCAVAMLGESSRFFLCAKSDKINSCNANTVIYCAKASKKDRGEGNNHPTVKATKLMEYLIRLITPPTGTVLDPFMGSGSTGVAANRLGFEFIGIEREAEYFAIAERRIKR